MPNTIVVGDTEHLMDGDYVLGALHARVGLKTLYKDNGTEAWKIGRDNESDRQHVRFGMDVLTAMDEGRVFETDPDYRPDRTETGRYGGVYFVMSEANWKRDFLHATGAYHASRAILTGEGRWLTPGVLRLELARRDIHVSTADCETVKALIWHDDHIDVDPLTADEIEMVENLPEPQRRIVEIMHEWHESDWRTSAPTDHVSWRAKRSDSWAVATVRKMEAKGIHLVRATGNGYITMQGKGMLAVEHWRERDRVNGVEGLPEATYARTARRW